MTVRIYNVTQVATAQAQAGNLDQDIFAYKGFNSYSVATGWKQHDMDLVKQDLLNHFNIRKGEKLMNPDFGTIIWNMIYEPLTGVNIQAISDDVTEIVNRDPRVNVQNVTVDTTQYGIRVMVDLLYVEFNLSEKIAIDFDNRKESKTTAQ